MFLRLMYKVALVSLLFLVTPLAKAQTVNLINPGAGDNRIASITDVTIAGTANDGVYTLTFNHGISYDTLELNLNPVSPITWTSSADADVVLDAIEAVVNAFGDVTGQRTEDAVIPFLEAPGIISTRYGDNGFENYSDWFSQRLDVPLSQSIAFPQQNAWVTATAVPEPSAFLCFGLALSGVIAVALRKKLAVCVNGFKTTSIWK